MLQCPAYRLSNALGAEIREDQLGSHVAGYRRLLLVFVCVPAGVFVYVVLGVGWQRRAVGGEKTAECMASSGFKTVVEKARGERLPGARCARSFCLPLCYITTPWFALVHSVSNVQVRVGQSNRNHLTPLLKARECEVENFVGHR